MRHVIKPECIHGCRFLQITDNLWLCEHAAYGPAVDQIGAVAEARRLLERAGGYAALLSKITTAEWAKKEERRKEREERTRAAAERVRYR